MKFQFFFSAIFVKTKLLEAVPDVYGFPQIVLLVITTFLHLLLFGVHKP